MKPAISVFIVITTIIALIQAQPTTTQIDYHNACTVSTYSCGMLEQKLKKMEAMLLSIAMGVYFVILTYTYIARTAP